MTYNFVTQPAVNCE